MKKILNYLLLLIIVIIPFNLEKNIKGVWVTTSDILILFLFIFWVFLVFRHKEKLQFKRFPLLPLIIVLLATFFISSLNSINIFLTLKETTKFIFIFAFFYLLVYNLNNKFSLSILPKIITFGAFIVSIWFLIDFLQGRVLIGGGRLWDRIIPTYTQLNSLGTYLTITIPFTFFLIFTTKKNILKAFYTITGVFQFIAIFLTFSRASWLAAGISSLLLLIWHYKRKSIIYIFVLTLLSFFLASFFITPPEIFRRFLSSFDSKEGSIVHRREYMRAAIELIKIHPITGVGLGNFQTATEKYNQRKLDIHYGEMVHNFVLQIGCEAGVIAMLIFVLIIVKYFYDSYFIYKSINDNFYLKTLLAVVITSFFGLFITGLFGDPFVRNTKEFFILLLALPYLIKSSSEKESF